MKMKKLYGEYIIVDDSRIDKGDWFLSHLGEVLRCIERDGLFVWYEGPHGRFSIHADLNIRKITHWTKPIIAKGQVIEKDCFDGIRVLKLSEVKNLLGKRDLPRFKYTWEEMYKAELQYGNGIFDEWEVEIVDGKLKLKQ